MVAIKQKNKYKNHLNAMPLFLSNSDGIHVLSF